MAFAISLNSKQIKDKIESAAYFKVLSIAKKKAEQAAKEKKVEFLQRFVEHPITQELLDPSENYGVDGQNGNLFSFLGFDSGSKPVEDLYKYFEKNIKLQEKYTYDKSNKTFKFTVTYPNIDEIKEFTDLGKYSTENNENGWGEGRSWAISIERGIPGLAYYKFSTDQKVLGGDSRSGFGLQRHNQIHVGAAYKPKRYISELLKILSNKR